MSNALGALPGKLHYPASSMGSPVRSGSGEPPGEEILDLLFQCRTNWGPRWWVSWKVGWRTGSGIL